jgi:hypothetical protein
MHRPRFQSDRLIVLLLEARRSRHSVVCSIPIIALIGLTLLRLLSDVELMAAAPFTIYFPAIVVTALLGGFWPGVVATLLVSMIAWYPTVPTELSPQAGMWFLLMVLVTAVNIAIMALVNAAVELTIQPRNRQEPAE